MPDLAEPKTGEAKERPIISNGWSIRGILSGRKTQTRRIMKPQPKVVDPPNRQTWTPERKWLRWKKVKQTSGALTKHCPYGQLGSILWVREAFRLPAWADEYTPLEYVEEGGWVARYEADGQHRLAGAPDHALEEEAKDASESEYWGQKRYPIILPRELCRMRLRVEGVRVERVQEISAADAYAEGIQTPHGGELSPGTPEEALSQKDKLLRKRFAKKWSQIHGEGAWERNEWVWVVEFSRIESS